MATTTINRANRRAAASRSTSKKAKVVEVEENTIDVEAEAAGKYVRETVVSTITTGVGIVGTVLSGLFHFGKGIVKG